MQKFKQNGKNPGNHKTPRDTLRISNGKELFLGNIDKRSKEARRVHDVYGDLMELLGGADNATEVQRQLAKQAAFLAVSMEKIAGDMVEGQQVDIAAYAKSVNTFSRLLDALGISPLNKPENDNESESLENYIAKNHPEKPNGRERI